MAVIMYSRVGRHLSEQFYVLSKQGKRQLDRGLADLGVSSSHQ